MNKKRKEVPPKLKKRLQKEINSQCPFCSNEEVEYFEFHHINEDRSDNEPSNLLMLCRICHSKITIGDLTKEEVVQKKNSLKNIHNEIEYVSVVCDPELSSWKADPNFENIFYQENKGSLILTWSFINHSNKTIILKGVKYIGKHLPVGLTGPHIPRILKPIAKYQIKLICNNVEHKTTFIEQIEIPKEMAFQFQTEFFHEWEDQKRPIEGRFYINFIFDTSRDQNIQIPRLFFNCDSEKEELQIIGYR